MPAEKKYTKEELAEREKNRKLRRAREVSEKGRDISEAMYSCMNPKRREECRLDLNCFLKLIWRMRFIWIGPPIL